MIFIKKFEASGFKSFADTTTLNFDYSMTGIVGPNGSGKSNITDAIRWALGEVSPKSLRGGSMEDVVFSGSVSRKALNIAEVTITFDNSKRIFKSLDFDEVSITRKYFKDSKDSEYFINKARVRQKDVQEAAIETGITKSSLAVISQGTISRFAEAKPEERRNIFDDAAGISIYKKRKEESVRKLIRTEENLMRVNDIVNEIERKLPTLKRQAEKAKQYKINWDELRVIEIAILVKDIEMYEKRLSTIKDSSSDIRARISDIQKDLDVKQNEYNSIYAKSFETENQLELLNVKFSKSIEKISEFKVLKINLESKKNTTNLNQEEYKINDIKNSVREIQIKLNQEEENYKLLIEEKNTKQALKEEIARKRFDLNNELESVKRQLSRLESTIEIKSSSSHQRDGMHRGVAAIIENKKTLPGIIGTVADMIKVEDKYDTAISALISGSAQNIVATDTRIVKQAVNFLKQNNVGFATFLPLDNIRINRIPDDIKFAIEKAKGFVSFANNVINIEKKYTNVVDYLCGTSIIMDNYDNAVSASKLVNQRYNIVTLDGERILPNGAIVGGKRNFRKLSYNPMEEIEKLTEEKNKKEELESSLKSQIFELSSQIDLTIEEITGTQSAMGTSRQTQDRLEVSEERLREEYRILTGKQLGNEKLNETSIDSQIIETIEKIGQLENFKTQAQQKITILRNTKAKYSGKQSELNTEILEQRQMLDRLKEQMSSMNTDGSILTERKTNSLQRLAQDYNLTFETASTLEQPSISNEEKTRARIAELRVIIKDLGNVNLDSIEEYENENSRYEEYQKQVKDILEGLNNIKEAIKGMDTLMVEQFTSVITEVNKALPETFKTLFGGGTAEVFYTDPNNMLETGVDIKVNPPGKKISNLNLLSGGEKSLVALTVLFSILKVKPLPIVILDEVEAPLDVANVERFAKHVKTFTKNTQFMIVTHRQGTMENCDVLFGATMEQKGITKIVQIKLVDAKELTSAN
ncbi:AAA family ATPase [Spiroplasma endosymbiont of Othius punctulatus]|uniref:AAA family ATPase n=1 Tax=Spiroplasma endosymbiont of Othius punctulatus TaxID=3066289 RepID=UPI0030D029B9